MEKDSGKIRVLVVAPSLREIGGQSVQARRIIDSFAGDREVEVGFVPTDPESYFSETKYLRTIFKSLRYWRLLLSRVGECDVVHVLSAGTTSYLISTIPAFVAARLRGCKTVLNYHDGRLREHLRNWPRTALPTMRKFDAIAVPSKFLKDMFAEFGLASTVVFNTVDLRRFAYRERERFEPIFLSNRNFEAVYNVADTLRAFRLIQDKFTDARLIVAGSGSEESMLRSLAEELRLENVEFIGRVGNDRMAELYDRADIFLNTSLADNMPLSFIEAFASGTAVVSYATGGIPYIVESGATGELVDVGDHAALAEKAAMLVENQQLAKKLVANARAEVVKYEWENVRRQWLEVYSGLARQKIV